jgi:hypothetical protein
LHHLLILKYFFPVNQRAFPGVIADVVLSSDDDDTVHPPEPDAPIDRKASAADDTGDVGTTSAKAIILGLIGTGAPGNPSPAVTNPIPMVPPARGHGCKRRPIAVKWSNLVPRVNQVMS